MKTKLLKKIRKRYSITYYQKQVKLYGTTFNGECMVLDDTSNQYKQIVVVEICAYENKQQFCDFARPTKELAKTLLLNKLSEWIANDYKQYRKRKIKQNIETIWYKS